MKLYLIYSSICNLLENVNVLHININNNHISYSLSLHVNLNNLFKMIDNNYDIIIVYKHASPDIDYTMIYTIMVL